MLIDQTTFYLFLILISAGIIYLIISQMILPRTYAQMESRIMAQITEELYRAVEQMGEWLGSSEDHQHMMLDSLRQGIHQSLTSQEQRMDQMRAATERHLTEIRRTVNEQLTENLDRRLNDSFQQVSQRLEQVYRGLGEMQSLAAGVGDLKKVLSNVKLRGTWGEMQLGALLHDQLSAAQIAENQEIIPDSGERVEFAIRLPGSGEGPIYLPIDSKFPMEDYARLRDAEDSGDGPLVLDCRRSLAKAIRTEAMRIRKKYVSPPYSTDFGILFLPSEGLYGEVMRDMALVESIQREHRVVIAGPSTFTALLVSLQTGFRTLAIQQRSSQVWQLLHQVQRDFGKFAAMLEKARLKLSQASESMDSAWRHTRTLQRSLDQAGDGSEEETILLTGRPFGDLPGDEG